MAEDSARINLTHHFLIAMPGLHDESFTRSVVYMCEHNDRGAVGLVINRPTDLAMADLFQKIDLPLRREDLRRARVLHGGPMHPERGFVLHEKLEAQGEMGIESAYASTMRIQEGGLGMTTSKDVLEAISTGAGPRRVLVTLGYSVWTQGQLESEIAESSWLTVAANDTILFETPLEQRYDEALSLLGLKAWMLSPVAGHA